VKGSDGEEEEDVHAPAALPQSVAPVRAPSVYCCGGERSLYCCGGAKESKEGGREEEKDGDAATALAHAVAPVGALSVHSCGDANEGKRFDGDTDPTYSRAVAPVGAPSAAVAGLYGDWRGYRKSCCCVMQRRFRKDQMTRRD
jgi:hypothetical protein